MTVPPAQRPWCRARSGALPKRSRVTAVTNAPILPRPFLLTIFMKRKTTLPLAFSLLALSFSPNHQVHAATGTASAAQPTGSVSGRVQNVATGQYLTVVLRYGDA